MPRHATAVQYAMRILMALLALGALLWSEAALACSCVNHPRSGFIHADLERLPSNARGALFLVPRRHQGTVAPDSFTITSDRGDAPLPAQVTWPRFDDNDAAYPSLARVGPAGGFKPGARYTIRYTGEPAIGMRTSTQFTIDATPLAPGPIALAMDGAPARTMLPMRAGASCSDIEAVVVGNFHYELPDSYAPYRSIVMYQSQSRTPGAAYEAIEYASSYCERRKLGVTARGDGRDLVHASCTAPPALLQVRGRAGLLEVEDDLQPTEPVTLDLANAAGAACDPAGMLREALASDDAERIHSVVCGFPTHLWGRKLATEALTTPSALFALVKREQPPPRACIARSVARIVAQTGEPPDDLGRFLAEDFASGDEQRIGAADQVASGIARELNRRELPIAVRQQRVEAFWQPMLPAIAGVVIDGKDRNADQLARVLGQHAQHSQAYVPALIAAGRRPAPSARPALIALTRLIPQDQRLRVLLRHAARQPVLLETAAVQFAEVATPAERPEVNRLLAKAIDAGSRDALFAVARDSEPSNAAVPALLRRLQRELPGGQTYGVFSSLLHVWQGEPEIATALSTVLLYEGMTYLHFYLELVAKADATARPLAPTLRLLLTRPLPDLERQAAEQALKVIIK